MSCREMLKLRKRIVVKVGTTTLTHSTGLLNLKRIERLSWVLTDLFHQGKEIILVSSGAIAVGTNRLKLDERPRDTSGKQAASAVGQAVLMQIYNNFFNQYNQQAAQILLTRDVLEDGERKGYARNTFFKLLSMGVIPIVNANDTVSTDELGFSDNDTLSAYVARLTDSDLLIMLSDIEGLYDSNPKSNPEAKLISEVGEITSDLESMAGVSSTQFGTGGMITKLTAVKIAHGFGIDAVIASGDEPSLLFDILDGAPVGTLFAAPTAHGGQA
ncbi:MAG: glutamate 5-kinase [Clostridiales bacterium]|nr:glutamate 5-kinase [Clostridiales bacterium]